MWLSYGLEWTIFGVALKTQKLATASNGAITSCIMHVQVLENEFFNMQQEKEAKNVLDNNAADKELPA